jgi:[protein-PII] uridylyltransferase
MSLRPKVLEAKQRLAEGRAKLRTRHDKGSPGIQVCRALTELFDSLMLMLFESALADLGDTGPDGLRSRVALVPHGGYGRGDVAPHSDVDLMILYDRNEKRVAPLAERMVRDVFDAGLVLGQAVRTPAEACQLARSDAAICTSLIESRLLVGSEELYNRYMRGFKADVSRRQSAIVASIERARAEERAQYGETVYLLEPNVKRSPGALRDLQLLRWVGFVRYGTADPDNLRLMGALSSEDHDEVLRAREFLLRLRNELHFHADKAADVLDRVEQVRLAELFGYRGTAGLLPVEQFMREYFRLTSRVSNVARRFIANSNPRSRWITLLAPLISHQFERDFRVEPHQITVTRRWLEKLERDPFEVLRLADLANLYNKPISHESCEAVRRVVPKLSDRVPPEASARFLSLLNQSARLGELLHTLHDLGVLERLIPAFEHARCLLQFNAYHKYTVDEHCLRAVAAATSFANDSGPLGSVYRHLKRKWLLHLALVLHDLGKGYVEDHSEVGLRIAEDTAVRLGLQPSETETLKFLVHKHLMMSHLAFRRDTSDNDLIVKFAVDVGSPESLEMLFVLTAADLAAVGPVVLNAWKVEVLADLFHRTMEHLGGDDPTREVEDRLGWRRQEVLALVFDVDDRHWWEKQVESLPNAYLSMTAPQTIADDLRSLRPLHPNEALARGRFLTESGTIEYTVGTHESIVPGVFHKLTGAITSQGLQILSADINTLAEGLVLDRFRVHDPDFSGEPPAGRIDSVCRVLERSLTHHDGKPPVFRRVWRPPEERRQASLSPLPTQVRVDNSTSDRFTIIDVFAADRMGLLYTISRVLFELGLSVSIAKIGTYLDQVVDVFYVTGREGTKIEAQHRIDEIRQRLLAEIDQLEREEATASRTW